MSTLVQFVPSTTQVFAFQPEMAGVQYNCTVTWNAFGQRWYLNVADASNNPLLTRALTSSGLRLAASLTWNAGLATVVCSTVHYIPLAQLANVRISGTGSTFDGAVQVLSVGPLTLTYALATDPEEPAPVAGTVNFDLNLVETLGIGTLLFHYDTQQFEYL